MVKDIIVSVDIMKNKLQEIYEVNKKLDEEFIAKVSDKELLYKSNTIELLVEIGEFVNETKCFKYWSIKKPNKELVLDEYADCITMVLFFFHYYDLDISIKNSIYSDDILENINELYSKATMVMNSCNKKLLIEILSLLLYIGKQLDLSDTEIITAITNKQNIVKNRLESEY